MTDRAKVMGFVVSAGFVALNIGSPLAIAIAGSLSWHYVFYLFSALSLACLVLSLFFLPAPDVKLGDKKLCIALYKERLFSFTGNREIAVSVLVFFLMLFGLAVLREMYPTWLFDTFAGKDITFIHISYLFLFGGIGGIAGSVLSGYLAAKVKDKMFYVAAMILLLSATSLVLPFALRIWQQFAVVFCMMVICSLKMPVFRTVLIGLVTPGERGSLNGLINSMSHLANAAGAYASTGLYGIDNTFRMNGYFTTAMLFCGSVMIWLFLTRKVSVSV